MLQDQIFKGYLLSIFIDFETFFHIERPNINVIEAVHIEVKLEQNRDD